MSDEELIARLRDTADHARFEPHLHHAALEPVATTIAKEEQK